MRRETLYLQDIIEACDLLETFLAHTDVSAFMASELHKAAALQKLAVIGEAAARLPEEFREKHREVEWRDVVAFRNIAVHATSPYNGTLFGQQRMTMCLRFEVKS